MSIKILHLSDLHLGNDIVVRAIRRRRVWWRRVDGKVTEGLAKAIRQAHPDYVVISGDFVNKPDQSQFAIAAKYLQQLFQQSGFDMQRHLLVVPGNHDVSFLPHKQPDDFMRLSGTNSRASLCS